jgi:predicted methyltransferase
VKIKESEEELKEIEMKCETCSAGKQARKKFSTDADKIPMPSQIGERIHTDICGPITPATWSGNQYFVSFIDEATRKSWIYFISSRDQMIEKYKEFNEMLITQKNVKIKTLRCDGAGEYISEEFKAYLKEKGTIQEVTPPYTAQWNGIAERMNRTLMDKARCMLKAKNLDNRFWGEATATAN